MSEDPACEEAWHAGKTQTRRFNESIRFNRREVAEDRGPSEQGLQAVGTRDRFQTYFPNRFRSEHERHGLAAAWKMESGWVQMRGIV